MLYCDAYNNIPLNDAGEYNILILEKSPHFRELISTELSKNTQYRVDEKTSLQEALEAFEKTRYDFIILDIHIEDSDSADILATLQQKSDAKIVITSDEADIQLRETLFKKGVLDYLVKDKNFESSIKSINRTIASTSFNRHYTVLVIDSSRFTCKQMQHLLGVRNYHVKTAHTAKEGFEMLTTSNISTIILDMELPDKHGLDLLRDIKNAQEFCHIPVITLSGNSNSEIIRECLKTGASDFIKKPFSIEEFTLKVDLSVETHKNYVQMLCAQKTLNEYKEAVDNSSLVSKTDTKGIITYVNEEFCKVSGYTKEELVGKPHNVVRHPDMPKSAFAELWETIQSGKTWKGVIKNRRKNGEAYYVKSAVSPITDADGNIVEYIAIRTDVTELETYKEMLKEDLDISNNNLFYFQQYEDALESFISVIKTNPANTITYVNHNYCELSGYSKNELLGKKCHTLRDPKHLRQGDCDRIAQQLKNKERVSFLFENLKKEGGTFFTNAEIVPLVDKNGAVTEHLHLMYDVTEIIKIHEELESTQKEIIYKMGEIGETRSKETGNHVKRVAHYSKLLAELYGLPQNECETLFTASPMHDIGKVGIPDAILNKPGRLSDEEFAIMKTHSKIGYNILKNSKRKTLRAAATIAYTHHEKWDGSGYPCGLKGEEIHVFGRITALADVFDALGSDRVYKKAWELEKILNLIKNEKGKHFEPKLVELFMENLDLFVEIRDKFKDIH